MQDLIAARFQEGLAHHQAQRFAEAQEAYTEVLGADPRHAEAWRRMSLLAEQFGRPDLALDWIGKAAALEPDNLHYLFAEAVTLQEAGRLADAEARYRRMIAINPDLADVHSNLGVVLRGQGRKAEALAAYQRAVALSDRVFPTSTG